MDLYGQEPEARLLASFLLRLEHRSFVDVGAERGAFAEAMLLAGSDAVHLIEPEPHNVAFLREHFGEVTAVTVHECAASYRDGPLQIHTSVSPAGEPITFGHSVLERPATEEIAWSETITVDARSLASLVEAGEIPTPVGIVKIDTEGHDLAVVAGLGALESDVLMVEHWSYLPNSLGPCPWTTEEMLEAARSRGFSNFVSIVHRGEFAFVHWNDGAIPAGEMANLVFMHDRVVERLLPAVIECASSVTERAVVDAEEWAHHAHGRLAVIEALGAENERLAKAATESEQLAKAAHEQLEALADPGPRPTTRWWHRLRTRGAAR